MQVDDSCLTIFPFDNAINFLFCYFRRECIVFVQNIMGTDAIQTDICKFDPFWE